MFFIKNVKPLASSLNTLPASRLNAMLSVQCQAVAPKLRKLELLAPAKNLEVGTAAILAGADAVYIGGSGFGARAAAGNDLNDIAKLCNFAHRFGARVYLTVNTLLYNQELKAVRTMIGKAVDAGVDALIVQDPAILTFPEVKNLELHASTQWNINTLDKVDYCAKLGLSQIVLPREFSLERISSFCKARPDLRFEVFVSGAMCVSVSGECFISEYMTKRSANRGECAQICRLPMELYHESKTDGAIKAANIGNQETGLRSAGADKRMQETGIRPAQETCLRLVARGHLLSMKDNLRLDQLLRLVEAGASSFKIEGRLKDRDYVVNQVAAFRERLDLIIEQYPELYARASIGDVEHNFVPEVNKTFNRGFTHAYLDDDNTDLVETRTPKSFGQNLGTVRYVKDGLDSKDQGLAKNFQNKQDKSGKFSSRNRFDSRKGQKQGGSFKGSQGKSEPILELTLNQDTHIANGDSFTYFNKQGELSGFRVNRVALNLNHKQDSSVIQCRKNDKVYLFLAQSLPDLVHGSEVYRNVDTTFIKQLEQPKAIQRKVKLQAVVDIAPISSKQKSEAKAEPSQGTYEQAANPKALENQSLAQEGVSLCQARCTITFKDEYGRCGKVAHDFEITSSTPLSTETMQDKLSKLGDDYLKLDSCSFAGDIELATFPISVFNQWRREALASYVAYVQLSRSQLKALATLALSTAQPSDVGYRLAGVATGITDRGSDIGDLAGAAGVSSSAELSGGSAGLMAGVQISELSGKSEGDAVFQSSQSSHMEQSVKAIKCSVGDCSVGQEGQSTLGTQANQSGLETVNTDGLTIAGEKLSQEQISALVYQLQEQLKNNQDSQTDFKVGSSPVFACNLSVSEGSVFMQSIPYLDTTVEDKVYHQPQTMPVWPENYVDRRLVTNDASLKVLEAGREEPLAEPRRLIAKAVMTCRTCLIKNHATCHKHGGRTSGFYLMIGGQRFDLVTDCKRCLMYVVPHAI